MQIGHRIPATCMRVMRSDSPTVLDTHAHMKKSQYADEYEYWNMNMNIFHTQPYYRRPLCCSCGVLVRYICNDILCHAMIHVFCCCAYVQIE